MNESPQDPIGRLLADAVPPLPQPPDRLGEVGARVRRTRVRGAAGATAGVVTAVGLALAVPQLLAAAPDSTQPAAGETVYRGTVLVVETDEHGPRMCPTGYPEPEDGSSYPECDGPEVLRWEWSGSAVDASTATGPGGSASATWGEYLVEGVWDGERFALTKPPGPADPELAPGDAGRDLPDPCPEPEGGRRAVDQAKTTPAARDGVLAWARAQPEYAGWWFERLDLPEGVVVDQDWQDIDPAQLVLYLRFTGDPVAAERRAREIWGGALCVSGAEYTIAELTGVHDQLADAHPQVLWSGVDVRLNAVVADVLIASVELRRELDQRYGSGAVVLDGYLEPVGS